LPYFHFSWLLSLRRQLELFEELEDSNDKDDLQEERGSNLKGEISKK